MWYEDIGYFIFLHSQNVPTSPTAKNTVQPSFSSQAASPFTMMLTRISWVSACFYSPALRQLPGCSRYITNSSSSLFAKIRPHRSGRNMRSGQRRATHHRAMMQDRGTAPLRQCFEPHFPSAGKHCFSRHAACLIVSIVSFVSICQVFCFFYFFRMYATRKAYE